jgi:23S rRNA C2498 (ribose-2'-O)-methylase RlmM
VQYWAFEGLDKLAVHPPSDKRIDPIPEGTTAALEGNNAQLCCARTETLKRALSYTPSKEDPARRQLEERKALEAAAKAKKQKVHLQFDTTSCLIIECITLSVICDFETQARTMT